MMQVDEWGRLPLLPVILPGTMVGKDFVPEAFYRPNCGSCRFWRPEKDQSSLVGFCQKNQTCFQALKDYWCGFYEFDGVTFEKPDGQDPQP